MEEISQEQLNEVIDYQEYPKFAAKGSNDLEGFQVFTSENIVNNMLLMIGDDVDDIHKVILEPASGDGAFTVRILERRIKKMTKSEYLRNSLIAVSTIFSIEMDEELIKKQRNNIFTLLCFYARNLKLELDESYIRVAKNIIFTNFIFGETNIDEPRKFKGDAVGRYMKDRKKIKFARWNITENILASTFQYEDAEANEDKSNLGGLFE